MELLLVIGAVIGVAVLARFYQNSDGQIADRLGIVGQQERQEQSDWIRYHCERALPIEMICDPIHDERVLCVLPGINL
jgi:hypothetical protein